MSQQTEPVIESLWAIVPAAGAGQRMQSDTPKQYLPLDGIPMLQRTLDALLGAVPSLNCVVALSANDEQWGTIPASHYEHVYTIIGGETRSESVLSGLNYINAKDSSNPWVLVHDAARPLVAKSDIVNLIESVVEHNAIGGLLAVPAQDTLKRSGDSATAKVEHTVERSNMWQAQTPQMFRAQTLSDAMAKAKENNIVITDESTALEYQNEHPLLVKAQQPNLKVTRHTDWLLADSLVKAHRKRTDGDS
ncbi:MAG: 2-C-methyl-D-erythritol 4-phosphate cytidylyltransferase [Gammaproteobacteria bacterium]|nr:2-C-methyl-D-erythritol 4-phosphate cytidylyltransferase [Gammaproteobacteria bacterium]